MSPNLLQNPHDACCYSRAHEDAGRQREHLGRSTDHCSTHLDSGLDHGHRSTRHHVDRDYLRPHYSNH